MNKGSKLFFAAVLALLITLSIYKYDQIVIKKNYLIYAHVSCNPLVEKCFVVDCAAGEIDCNNATYKKIQKKASNIPVCGALQACPELFCDMDESECVMTECSDVTRESDELCAIEANSIQDESSLLDN